MAILSSAIGEARQGIDLLDEALAEIDRTGQRWCLAELQRFKAELQAGGIGQRFPKPEVGGSNPLGDATFPA